MRVVGLEGKAVAVVSAHVVDAVLEAAGLADNWQSTITGCNHLSQTAGLALGRHQEGVGAGVNLLGEIWQEANLDRHAARIAALHLIKEVFIVRIARAEQDEGDVVPHQDVEDVLDQIQALVGYQAGNHADQHSVFVRLQAHLLHQLDLVDLLILQRMDVIIFVDVLVGLWIVGLHVDTVEDADHTIALGVENRVQAVREPRVMDLHRVAWAYRIDDVDLHDRRLHHVQAAVIFQHRILVFRNTKHIPGNLHAVLPLILDVVDGEHRLDIVVFGDAAVEGVQINRHQRGVPIVGMDDVRVKVDVVEHLHRRLGEEGEALRVVVVAVQIVPLKVILVVQEVVDNPLMAGFENAAILVSPGKRNVKVAHKLHPLAELLRDVFIKRNDHPALVAGVAKRLWQ